ncbi:hypothetical protein ACWC4E_34610 [Streptomyces sp. NPDC001273]|uniref:hypothetical protein n=1 Tax=unclassified Streptomyces TaxID=2593676 RepID=UPI0033F48BF2
MIAFRRTAIATALVGLTVLSAAAPATASAQLAARASFPSGCASTTGYSDEGGYSGRLTVCFTEDTRYDGNVGAWVPASADSVEGRCWQKRITYNERNCKFSAKLTLKKDGQHVWTENRQLTTDYLHSGATTIRDNWRCRGEGTYSLTLHDISILVENGGIANTWERVHPKDVTVTAKGC